MYPVPDGAFVLSLIEAAATTTSCVGGGRIGPMITTPSITPSPQPSPTASASLPPSSSGVYYSTVMKPQSAVTTAASSPAAAFSLGPSVMMTSSSSGIHPSSPKGSPMIMSAARDRRMSSCDGWEYAVACPPAMYNIDSGNLPPLGFGDLDNEDEEY
jgi:hypothetical protein